MADSSEGVSPNTLLDIIKCSSSNCFPIVLKPNSFAPLTHNVFVLVLYHKHLNKNCTMSPLKLLRRFRPLMTSNTFSKFMDFSSNLDVLDVAAIDDDVLLKTGEACFNSTTSSILSCNDSRTPVIDVKSLAVDIAVAGGETIVTFEILSISPIFL